MVQPMDGRSASEGAEDGDQGGAVWPPTFPHLEIDALIDRLASGGSADHADAHHLLGLVAGEAQRLRTTVVRLVTAKLSEADREAQRIVVEAIDEGERLVAAARESIRVQERAAGSARRERIRVVPDQSPDVEH